MRSDSEHLELCRKCEAPRLRSEMKPASQVLRRSARGWYCLSCAAREGLIARGVARLPGGQRESRRR